MARLIGQPVKLCYWKSISESHSQEGEIFRNQHQEIPFYKCKYSCVGNKVNCPYYELREMDLVSEEIMEDSSRITGLDEMCI